jgi:hypothetical protein
MSEPKVLGPQAGYVEILNHYTQEAINEYEAAPSKYNPLRPSSAGKCERELGYEFMEFRGLAKYPSEPKSPETHRLLNFGHPIETHVIWQFQDAFKRMPKPIQIKYKQHTLSFFKLADGTRVEGNIDMTFISEKHGALVDVKSKKDKFSAFYKTSWDEMTAQMSAMKSVHKFGEDAYWVEDLAEFIKELDDPFFAANFYQLNLYFWDEHSFIREKGIDHAAILQYNKNDSRMREIRFKPCETIYQETKDKFLRVQEVVDRDKSPDALKKDYVLGSSKCGFCKFRGKCWESTDEAVLKEHFKTWPKKFWPKDIDRLEAGTASQLKGLFKEYLETATQADKAAKLEESIIKLLDAAQVRKIKLSEDAIYEVKHLKTGGVGGGPRAVLRRSKV